MRMPQPYPISYPRNVDFMPLLSFQREVDSDLMLHYFDGTASIGLMKTVKTEETKSSQDHRITYQRNPLNRQETIVNFDAGRFEDAIPQKDIWDITMDDLGATIPEVVTHARNTVEPIPKQLEDSKELQGINSIVQFQRKGGAHGKSIKRRFGLDGMVNDPFSIFKGDAMERECWNKDYSLRLRSVLKTESILGAGEHNKGWTDLFLNTKKDHKFSPLTSEMNRELTKNKWWSDTGIPIKMLGHMDSQRVEGVIYSLVKHERQFIIL